MKLHHLLLAVFLAMASAPAAWADARGQAKEQVEFGILRFKAGEGAQIHSHPHEQIVYVLKGRMKVLSEAEVKSWIADTQAWLRRWPTLRAS